MTDRENIKQGLLHPDGEVRDAALGYFTDSWDRDPSLMPLVVQALEKYGCAEAFADWDFIHRLPQTAETLLRTWELWQAYREGPDFDDREDEIQDAFCQADVLLLKNNPDILETLDDISAVQCRLKQGNRPPEALWRELKEHCRDISLEDMDEFEDEHLGHLTEALARHPDFLAPRVLQRLAAPRISPLWRGVAARLAGAMRLETAVPFLVSLLTINDQTFDREADVEFQIALRKINGAAVAAALAQEFATNPHFHFCLVALFQDLHCDQSVHACWDLWRLEKGKGPAQPGYLDAQTEILTALLRNFEPAAIEPARQLILEHEGTDAANDLREELLPVCKLLDIRFPEFNAWQAEAVRVKEEEDWQEDEVEDWDEDEDEDWQEDEDEDRQEDEDEDRQEEPGYSSDQFQDPPFSSKAAYVGPAKKVGRNDPCPCGSGKKFKKCCYGKEKNLFGV